MLESSRLPRSRHPPGASCHWLGEASLQPRMDCLLVEGTDVLRGACTLQRSRRAHQGDLPPTAIPSKPRNLPWLPTDQRTESQLPGLEFQGCQDAPLPPSPVLFLSQSTRLSGCFNLLDTSRSPGRRPGLGESWGRETGRTRSGTPVTSCTCVPGKLHPSSLRRQGDTCELGQRCPESCPPGPSPSPQWAAWPMHTVLMTLTCTGLPGTLQFAKGFLPID